MGHTECVEFLLDAKADIKYDNGKSDESTALSYAVEFGQIDITEILLKANADPNQTYGVRSPLSIRT